VNIPANSLVAVDTQILIWGGLRKCVPGLNLKAQADADKERRAHILLYELDELKAKIIIPSVIVAELLCPIDPQDHNNFLAEITRRFECPSFDIRATSLAARLWRHNRSLSKEEQISRSILKADVQIIATAKIRGVVHFFSDDGDCRKLATVAGMISHSLPTHALNLFTETELKDKEAVAEAAPKADTASG
jgi:PIN domain